MRNENLIQARKRAGFTQETLAKEVGVEQGMISKYENGIVYPSLTVAYKISKLLNVPMEVFVIEQTAS